MSGLYVSLCNQHNCEHELHTARKFDNLVEHLLCIPQKKCSQLEEILHHVESFFEQWMLEIWGMLQKAYSYRTRKYADYDGFLEDFESLHDISQLICIERVFMALLPLFNEAYYNFTMSENDIRLSTVIAKKAKNLLSSNINERRKAYNYICIALYHLEKNCRELLSGLQVAKPMYDELFSMLDISQISFLYEMHDINLGDNPDENSTQLLGERRLAEFVEHTTEFFKKQTKDLKLILSQTQNRCELYNPKFDKHKLDTHKRIICICLGTYYISISNYDDFFNIEYGGYLRLCKKYYLLNRNNDEYLEKTYIKNTIHMMLGVSNASEFILWSRSKKNAAQTPVETLEISQLEKEDLYAEEALEQLRLSPLLFM